MAINIHTVRSSDACCLGNRKTRVAQNSCNLSYLSLVLLFISDLTNGLCLHQFLETKSEEANKSVKTDANGAHQ